MENLRIEEALEQMPEGQTPPEVEASLQSLGFPAVLECKRLKISFHATYLLRLDGPAVPAGEPPGSGGDHLILQLLGSELGDKALFHMDHPISAPGIAKATALALEAGVKAPQIWATGELDSWGPLQRVPFVIEEFVETTTVEDEVIAPREQWDRIARDIRAKLGARSLAGVDTAPLPRFEDVFAYTAYLLSLAAEVGAVELVEALQRLEAEFREKGIAAVPPTLVHQDINDGNLLCSPDPDGTSGAWRLDGLIDFESASVADPRIAYERGEPWASLRQVAQVVKGRRLAALVAAGKVPRCVAGELFENYEEHGKRLVTSGRIPHLEPVQLLQ